MNNISKNILALLILAVISHGNLFAQSPSKSQYIKAAEKEFAAKNYYAALIYYNTVLEFDEEDPEFIFKSAESARLYNAFALAAQKYSYLVDSLADNTHPTAVFWLANMNQRLGEYEKANKYYNIFISEYGDQDSLLDLRAKKEMVAIDYAKNVVANPKKNVKFEKLGEDVNSNSSDVAASWHNDKLTFASTKFTEEKPLEKPAREISKILIKKGEDGAELMQGYINSRDSLVSNGAYSPDRKQFYYTVCRYLNGSEFECKIYRSDIDSLGNLSNETLLTDPINLDGSTSTHPHLVLDKVTGKTILYFVSNRDGGQGKLDIYSAILDPTFGFSQPINLTTLNTAEDDITPFYNYETNFLYFSSNGRLGLGGFDIYKSAKTNDAFSDPVGLGLPFNSSFDDIYYFDAIDTSTVYLSSNREGSLYLDSYFEACCFDIYKADIIKIKLDLNALTYDKLTGRNLKMATVILLDQDTGEEIARFRNDDGNDHIFDIDEDRKYIIIAERENYYPDTVQLSTIGMEKDETIIKKMYLSTDMMLLDVFTFTKIGKLPLDSTTVTLIDMSDASKKDIVETNPFGNEYNFMIDRGKLYKLIATKNGYTEAIDTVDTRPYDKSGLIRRDLYLDKFVLQDLLPISLFFDNDLPDINSNKTITKSKYGDLVSNYVAQKNLYKNKFSKPLPKDQKEKFNESYEVFFEGDVNGGYDKFKMFLVNLVYELEAGNKVELVLKGFASPRADSKYNLALGQRRVHSVKNEMLAYNNQIFKKYFDSGQLIITDISFGKELAPPDVIGTIEDERNSIYNLKAAKERRVEILRASRN